MERLLGDTAMWRELFLAPCPLPPSQQAPGHLHLLSTPSLHATPTPIPRICCPSAWGLPCITSGLFLPLY